LLKFLNSGPARLVTLLLLAQAAVMYSSIRPEAVPPSRPLAGVPQSVNGWVMTQENVVDAETQEILKADDTLNRTYIDASNGRGANLFIAAFRSQRNGKTPHSPKNCLPGSGYTKISSEDYPIDVGAAEPIVVNRFIVQHGEAKSIVMYWYQSRDRVVADEYRAKFWVIADAIRLNRTDTALVRVVVPIMNGDETTGTRTAVDFVKAFYGPVRQYLPS
jgi:EpsI family protein